jgi:hypothetical protein
MGPSWDDLCRVCRDSVVGKATRYGLDVSGIESRWGRDFPYQTGTEAHTASSTMGIASFPGVKRPGCVVNHSPPSNAVVKERVRLYLYSRSVHSWQVTRLTFFYLYFVGMWNMRLMLAEGSVLSVMTVESSILGERSYQEAGKSCMGKFHWFVFAMNSNGG